MFTELHREEKREEGDRGGQEDKGGNQKETDPASNQFPKCSPQPGTHKKIQYIMNNAINEIKKHSGGNQQ